MTINIKNFLSDKSKLSKMSVDQLKEYCGNLGYQVDGTKTDLINRILNNQKSWLIVSILRIWCISINGK